MKQLILFLLLLSSVSIHATDFYSDDLKGTDFDALERADYSAVARFLRGGPSPLLPSRTAEAVKAQARALVYRDYLTSREESPMHQMVDDYLKTTLQELAVKLNSAPRLVDYVYALGVFNALLADLQRALVEVRPAELDWQRVEELASKMSFVLTANDILFDPPRVQALAARRANALLAHTSEAVRLFGNVMGLLIGKMALRPHKYSLKDFILTVVDFRGALDGRNSLKRSADPELNTIFGQSLVARLLPQLLKRELALTQEEKDHSAEKEIIGLSRLNINMDVMAFEEIHFADIKVETVEALDEMNSIMRGQMGSILRLGRNLYMDAETPRPLRTRR